MLGVIGKLVRSKGPPLLLAFFLVVFAGLFISNVAANGAAPAPSIGVVLILAPIGAFVLKRLILPDFMSPTSRRKRSPRSGIDSGAKARSRGGFSRYSKPRRVSGRLNSHRHSGLVPTTLRA